MGVATSPAAVKWLLSQHIVRVVLRGWCLAVLLALPSLPCVAQLKCGRWLLANLFWKTSGPAISAHLFGSMPPHGQVQLLKLPLHRVEIAVLTTLGRLRRLGAESQSPSAVLRRPPWFPHRLNRDSGSYRPRIRQISDLGLSHARECGQTEALSTGRQLVSIW